MFKALASPGGTVSRVMPVDKTSMLIGVLLAVIFLRERPGAMNWAGIALMTVGAVMAGWKSGT
jgi:transporter family protein